MRKPTRRTTVTRRGPVPHALGSLIAEVRSLIQTARHAAASTVNTLQVLTNCAIGRRIVERNQKGAKRPEGGSAMQLDSLQHRLIRDDFSEVNGHV